jgi:hypothetical protein
MPRASVCGGFLALGALLTVLAVHAGNVGAQTRSDSEIRRQMIRDSLAGYSGNCPCPYNIMRNGSPCGRFSAWSKPGGQSPLCFDKDISDAEVEAYRRRHGLTLTR